jgi:hypothetical protein
VRNKFTLNQPKHSQTFIFKQLAFEELRDLSISDYNRESQHDNTSYELHPKKDYSNLVISFDSRTSISTKIVELKAILEAMLDKSNLNTEIVSSLAKKYKIKL